MNNEQIAKQVGMFANVSIDEWAMIDELAQQLHGEVLVKIQGQILRHYKEELINTMMFNAEPGRQPKHINNDMYAGLLKGLNDASLKCLAKIAKSRIEAERKRVQTENKVHSRSQLQANPLI